MTTFYDSMLRQAQRRRERIIKMREAGKTLQEIASKLGVSHQRIQQILKKEAKKEATP